MKDKEFLKRISKISESYEEILMLLSKTETKGEKSYKQNIYRKFKIHGIYR